MGSPERKEQPFSREYQHRVRITKPFYLGVYEVTQEGDIDAQLNSPTCAPKYSPGDSQQVVMGMRFAGGSAENERRFGLGLWAA
jgi:hypothetical protein